MIDYKEAKRKVSIIEILVRWGYKYDKSKGAVSPNFVLRDEQGKEIDRVVITHPQEPEKQGYWRRGGAKGDLISFIREHQNQFPVVGRNEVDTVNKVLALLMGQDFPGKPSLPRSNDNHPFDLNAYVDIQGIRAPQPFDLATIERLPGEEHIDQLIGFFATRGITKETVETFAPYIELVGINIGFPYRVPGSEEVVGYELRGLRGFKGKAEGTNSTTGLWMADFIADHPSWAVRKVYFFESALDAMAFWQLNHDKISTEPIVLASTGGSFSDQQIIRTMAYYKNAQAVDCFDNDAQGRIYGCRMVALVELPLTGQETEGLKVTVNAGVVHFQLNGKQFEMAVDLMDVDTFRAITGIYNNKVEVWKAPKGYKDWNEVIM